MTLGALWICFASFSNVAFAMESSVAQISALTAAQTKSIDRYVTAEMTRQRIPGVEIGVYRNGQSVLAKG
jgi:hypothetical protein